MNYTAAKQTRTSNNRVGCAANTREQSFLDLNRFQLTPFSVKARSEWAEILHLITHRGAKKNRKCEEYFRRQLYNISVVLCLSQPKRVRLE